MRTKRVEATTVYLQEVVDPLFNHEILSDFEVQVREGLMDCLVVRRVAVDVVETLVADQTDDGMIVEVSAKVQVSTTGTVQLFRAE